VRLLRHCLSDSTRPGSLRQVSSCTSWNSPPASREHVARLRDQFTAVCYESAMLRASDAPYVKGARCSAPQVQTVRRPGV
jgi:hypothetical protein